MMTDRRTFIGIAIGLITAPLGAQAAASAFAPARPVNPSSSAATAFASTSSGARPAISPGALLATLTDPAAAGQLGQHYLAEHPQERDMNRLVDQLLLALNTQQGKVQRDRIALQQALSTLIQQEYITSQLLSVDGWLLAPSEARLYALAALGGTSQQVPAPAHLHSTLLKSRPASGC